MHEPRGVAMRGNYIAVADHDLCRIQLLDARGNLVKVWGHHGENPGELRQPSDLAMNDAGEIFVADSGNNRIQAFDKAGDQLWSLGQFGSGPGDFDRPQGIAVADDGLIFVSDTENHRLQVIWPGGAIKGAITLPAAQQLNAPTRLAIDQDEVFIADRGNQRIAVIDTKGRFLRAWPAPGAGRPDGIAVLHGEIVVSDAENAQIWRFDRNGTLLGTVGAPGSGSWQLDTPAGIASDGSRIAIADSLNHRVVVTDLAVSWAAIGGRPFPSGHLYAPRHLVHDPKTEQVYVVDRGNERIAVFDARTGAARFDFSAPGLNDPFGIALNGDELVVAANIGSLPHIYVFDHAGTLLNILAVTYPAGISPGYVHGIAVDRQRGRIWISDHAQNLLMQLDLNGVCTDHFVLDTLDIRRAPPPMLYQNSPTDVAVTANEHVVVADPNSNAGVPPRIWVGNVQQFVHARRFSRSTLGGVNAIAVDASRDLVYAVRESRLSVVDLNATGTSMVTEHLGHGGAPGQLIGGAGVTLTPDGRRLFIAERGNHRVQAFDIQP